MKIDIEQYLKEMEESDLLYLLYNGYLFIHDKPTVKNVTLEIALADKGFCKFTEDNLRDEYKKGI